MTRNTARFALAPLFAVGLVLFALTGCGGQSAVDTVDAPPVLREQEATPTALPATATPLPVKPTTPPIAATEIPAQRRESALTGQQAPDFLLALYQGQSTLGAESLMLSDLRGKPVVLNFWARLCQPCWSEMPELQEFYEESRQQVEVVGVDIGQFTGLGSGRDAGKLLQSLGITYPAGTTDDGYGRSPIRCAGDAHHRVHNSGRQGIPQVVRSNRARSSWMRIVSGNAGQK